MTVSLAPCGWTPVECGCALDLDDPSTQAAVEMSAYVLWALSGRQFGCCERSVRPCRRSCIDSSGGSGPQWTALLDAGQWVNRSCRSCSGSCACQEVSEVQLPGGPVCEVIEVVLNGTPAVTGTYRVEDGDWLVLSDGAQFPVCQDMAAPLGAEGTSGVRYTTGTPVPTAGQVALGALSCEIKKACAGDDKCQLPARAREVARRGITAVILDPQAFLDKGRTGLTHVDLFLIAANPLGRPAPARVLSPDSEPRHHEVTWP